MNNKTTLRLTIVIVLHVIILQKAIAQTAPKDSGMYTPAVKNTLNIYNHGVGDQTRLLNGHEYAYYDRLIKGDAYYEGYEWRPATLYYDGAIFEKTPVLYDIVKDLIVVKLPDDQGNYSLVNDKLLKFVLLNRTFVNVTPDSTNTKITPGFYELLYTGKSEALSKTTKTIDVTSTIGNLEKSFLSHKNYFLKRGKTYYEVSGEGDVLKVFKDKKKELQQYIKTYKIKYHQDPEQALIKITTYFDQLSQ